MAKRLEMNVLGKMSGSGNSFILIEEDPKLLPPLLPPWGQRQSWVKNFFKAHQADGLFFLKIQAPEKITWDFYNRDGSLAQMCGNATRCVGRYYFDNNPDWTQIHLETLSGSVHLKKRGNKVCVQMPKITVYNKKVQISYKNKVIEGVWLDSGVPHFVLCEEKFPKDFEMALFCRQHEMFSPSGTNVTFLKKKNEKEIQAVSFERGVEDFTFACGTGAVAASFAYTYFSQGEVKDQEGLQSSEKKHITVHLPGGIVEVELLGHQGFLIGDAIYEDLE